MEGLPTCANCLSIARDAKTMGIDVDGPQNDKGLYGLIPLHKVSSISNDYIIDWRAFSDKFAQKRFGFMSQVSPDGKFVVTSIEVPGGLEKIDAPATEFYRLFDISAQLADKKQFDAAVLAWNNALVLAPGDPRGHHNLDTLADAGGSMKPCRSSKSRLSSIPSDAAGANLGNALAATGGHLEEAIQQLNQGIELQLESASAQNGLGVALARAGRLEDAVVQMDKAVAWRRRRSTTGITSHACWLRTTAVRARLFSSRKQRGFGMREPAILEMLAATYSDTGCNSRRCEHGTSSAGFGDQAARR